MTGDDFYRSIELTPEEIEAALLEGKKKNTFMKKTKTTGKNKKGATVKRRSPRKMFALELIDKLQRLNVGDVSYDFMGDNSCFWVELRIRNKTLGFTFEPDQDRLCRVALFEDVVEVTDQKQIFGK